MKKKIDVSVLMIYFNQEYEINLILEAFLLQTFSRNNFEIIIIDDGTEVSIEDTINKYIEKGLNIIYHKISHIGNRAYNRHLATTFAKGEYIIFLDSDLIPCKNFIEKHYNNLKKNPKIVSIGYRKLLLNLCKNLLTTDIIQDNFLFIENLPSKLDERIPFIYAHKKMNLDLTKAWYMAYSHNIALRRSLYDKTEGFDENFQFGWGVEDVEFALRLFKVGARFYYDETITIYHIPHNSDSNIQSMYQTNLNYFYNKHKSCEAELFQLHHLMNPINLCKLYCTINSNSHLQNLDVKEYVNYEKTLFVGFRNFSEKLKQNGNNILSTQLSEASYRLIGIFLPYEDKQFNQVILSQNYNLFQIELLYKIITELIRVGTEVKICKDSKILITLDEFWKQKTSFTFKDWYEIFQKIEQRQ